ncbi:hypothetical protein GCM10007973_05430 [Polymorphobacter multimanifer]|nr:hypothetical protein GCM10007973_05430 [Polymorphobacter multimanifer]
MFTRIEAIEIVARLHPVVGGEQVALPHEIECRGLVPRFAGEALVLLGGELLDGLGLGGTGDEKTLPQRHRVGHIAALQFHQLGGVAHPGAHGALPGGGEAQRVGSGEHLGIA